MTGEKIFYAINKITEERVIAINANKEDRYKCPNCNKDIIFRKGEINKPHFSHSSNYECGGESDIHIYAKLLLKYILENKQLFVSKNDEIIEISRITNNVAIIIECEFNYNGAKKIADIVYAKLNGTEWKMEYIFEICYTNKTLEKDRPEPWYEFDAESVIREFNENIDENIIYLECIRGKKLMKIKNERIITLCQRGAGNGKTYEAVQLVQNDIKYNNKNTFLYLTKMHSAKDVIYNEFKQQEKRGAIKHVKSFDYDYNKKYGIKYYDNERNKEIVVLIGTIDSFCCVVADSRNSIEYVDQFKTKILNIADGYTKSFSQINYAGVGNFLNEKCLIIIDEAQSLDECYLESFEYIIYKFNTDLYVIGDILQSIWFPNNLLVSIDKKSNNIDKKYTNKNNITYIVDICESENHIRRFHNKKFVNFVNKIVPFEKYNLKPITRICEDIDKCGYIHEDGDNNENPYRIIEMPKIYANEYDRKKIDNVLKIIIKYVDVEVKKYRYIPNNFMFIFPILKNNIFANMLHTTMQKYWIEKFKDIEYQNEVLKYDEYWKDKINDNIYHNYIYLHKADSYGPIDLRSSENSSRILSIHSSLGSGCEVVFVLGMTEKALKILSKIDEDELVYNSLIHVAITRHKKSLYIGIEEDSGDIYDRFKQFDCGIKEPNLSHIKNKSDTQDILNIIIEKNEIFNDINENIIIKNNYRDVLNDGVNNKGIIDWGDHGIRYIVSLYYWMVYIVETRKNKWDQLLLVVDKLKNVNPIMLTHKKYYNYLDDINNLLATKNKEFNKIKEDYNKVDTLDIPILKFEEDENSIYHKCSIILQAGICDIIGKIKENRKNNEIPKLNSLECIILFYMIEIKKRGRYTNIPIMYLYNIINAFGNNGDVNFKDHYDTIRLLKITYQKYDDYMKLKGISDLKYNIYQYISIDYKLGNNVPIIGNMFPIIGRTDDMSTIVYFRIIPDFNYLNFNTVICEEIINNYIIYYNYNNVYKNIDKKIKNIYTFIITFESEDPIVFNFDIVNNSEKYREIVNKCLYHKYKQYNKIIYNFYNFSKAEDNNNKLINRLNDILLSYNYLPNYISKLINLISEMEEEMEMDYSEDKFYQKYDYYLNMFIDQYNSILDNPNKYIDNIIN